MLHLVWLPSPVTYLLFSRT